MTQKDYEALASKWAEEYGIATYKVNGCLMTYLVDCTRPGTHETQTFKCTVDLDRVKNRIFAKLGMMAGMMNNCCAAAL